MNRIILFTLLFLQVIGVFAQSKGGLKAELGVTAGCMYYMGDVNQDKLFYKVQPAFGAVYKYNFTDRWVLKISAVLGKIAADDNDFFYDYQENRNYSFSTRLTDLTAQVEFNFLSLLPESKFSKWTPYVSGGIGGYMASDIPGAKLEIAIPFAVGVKYCPLKRLSTGIEWGMRKTFSDNLDGLSSDYQSNIETKYGLKQKTFVENFDYFSYAGFYITYKFFLSKYVCQAYRKNSKAKEEN
jgi:hypothetical protein